MQQAMLQDSTNNIMINIKYVQETNLAPCVRSIEQCLVTAANKYSKIIANVSTLLYT